ncbi:MAG: cation diffusion facilitator family transporter [Gammaproteobacteria bacterium]|uniref:cation diffusion facilitator family transporter n=1 Tax=Nitrosomonas sp. TaxID=42353 RepID=UPI001DFD517C|nr:cation diffusion facilitator family transporter [Nitrosomonas sp.]MBX9637771.1 cation diffusion facilitator family transporter [Nitrosomonas sp.]MBY0377790.1 cation diffusion facilitator family transporter [Gammaproteobacteria bacterium]MBY0484464.1 cation diffusion facilitator family transporter [Nitrosomonas sp.]MBY0544370.1 cation diffusion facilitator family transporter [Gammaproteobacteria bacterium]
MNNCGCQPLATTNAERKILKIALTLNVLMFIVGLVAGIVAQSTGLIADSFDMLADASAYTIALLAINRSFKFKAKAATISGGVLLILGASLLIEALRRVWVGSFPESSTMIIIASISLIVNTIVLRLLGRFRKGEAHLRATWIFTRADVVANISVIVSGILVAALDSRFPDLIIGFAIGLYIIKEAFEILNDARKGDSSATFH